MAADRQLVLATTAHQFIPRRGFPLPTSGLGWVSLDGTFDVAQEIHRDAFARSDEQGADDTVHGAGTGDAQGFAREHERNDDLKAEVLKRPVRRSTFGLLDFSNARGHIAAQRAQRIDKFGERQSVKVSRLGPLADQALGRFNVRTDGYEHVDDGTVDLLQSASLFRGEGGLAAFRALTTTRGESFGGAPETLKKLRRCVDINLLLKLRVNLIDDRLREPPLPPLISQAIDLTLERFLFSNQRSLDTRRQWGAMLSAEVRVTLAQISRLLLQTHTLTTPSFPFTTSTIPAWTLRYDIVGRCELTTRVLCHACTGSDRIGA